jgi:hypothetical protein
MMSIPYEKTLGFGLWALGYGVCHEKTPHLSEKTPHLSLVRLACPRLRPWVGMLAELAGAGRISRVVPGSQMPRITDVPHDRPYL